MYVWEGEDWENEMGGEFVHDDRWTDRQTGRETGRQKGIGTGNKRTERER